MPDGFKKQQESQVPGEQQATERVADRELSGPGNSVHHRSQEGLGISLKCSRKSLEGFEQGNDMTQLIF